MTDLKNTTPLARLLSEVAQEKVPGFVVDAFNREILNQIYYYIAQSPRFEFTSPELTVRTGFYLGRGNMFSGNPGCGKTDLMRILQRVFYVLKDSRMFPAMSMIDFSRNYGQKDDRGNVIDMLTKYEGRHLFIDEFGMVDENTGSRKYEIITNFGTKMDLGELVILQRYNEFKRGYITHITTNITEADLSKQYDSRTVSRLYEMCNVFAVIGPDRRRTAQPRTNLAPPPDTDKSTFLDLLPLIKDKVPHAYKDLVKTLDKLKAQMILNGYEDWKEKEGPKLTQESALKAFTDFLPNLSLLELQDALKQADLKQNRELIALVESELTRRNSKAA